jgi:hypothetical protein
MILSENTTGFSIRKEVTPFYPDIFFQKNIEEMGGCIINNIYYISGD